MSEGSPFVAAAAALTLLGGLLSERALLRWRPRAYFRVGFPLGAQPVPVAAVPQATSGRTAMVRWERDGDELFFWAEPSERKGPMGLHGHVAFVRTTRNVQLDVTWAPPWTPLIAAVWLAGLGAARGEAALTAPISMVIVVGVLVLYRQSAVQAAAELRYALSTVT